MRVAGAPLRSFCGITCMYVNKMVMVPMLRNAEDAPMRLPLRCFASCGVAIAFWDGSRYRVGKGRPNHPEIRFDART